MLPKSETLGDPRTRGSRTGEAYGAALLAAGQVRDAEAVFAAELKRYPNDPHSEWRLPKASRRKARTMPRRAPRTGALGGSRDLTLSDLGDGGPRRHGVAASFG